MDGDRIIDLVGGVLVVGLLVSVAVVALAGMYAPEGEADLPNANWTVERVNDSHVRIEHAGGEPVRTENLLVSVDGTARRVTWGEVVAEGDGGTFLATRNATVRLYWVGGRGDRTSLGTWTP